MNFTDYDNVGVETMDQHILNSSNENLEGNSEKVYKMKVSCQKLKEPTDICILAIKTIRTF